MSPSSSPSDIGVASSNNNREQDTTICDSPEDDNRHGNREKNGSNDISVQLGFCIPIESDEQFSEIGHYNTNFHLWDGGVAGGWPSWLNPSNIPKKPLRCTICTSIMNFICQLYAPLDDGDVDNNDNEQDQNQDPNDAFHRTFYIFACPNYKSPGHTPSTSIRVLRCQLPEINPYWPSDEECKRNNNNNNNEGDKNDTIVTPKWGHSMKPLCIVCGFPSAGKCPLQNVYFCCKQHQTIYKKYVFNKLTRESTAGCRSSDEVLYETTLQIASLLPNVYHMTEIVVEGEPPSYSQLQNKNTNNKEVLPTTMFPSKSKEKHHKSSSHRDDTNMDDINNESDADDDDSDADMEQDDLNDILQGGSICNNKQNHNRKKKNKTDLVYDQFIHRVVTSRKKCQSQVIRYCRWPKTKAISVVHENDIDDAENENSGGPLWIRKDYQPDTIPPCQYCGASRNFEFQIMPQMVHYLLNGTSDHVATGSDNNNHNQTKNSSIITNELKNALEQTEQFVQQAPPELIPPALIDAQEAAIERIHKRLFDDSETSTTTNNSKQEVNWGVIAIYSCTRSCNNKKLEKKKIGQSQCISNVDLLATSIDNGNKIITIPLTTTKEEVKTKNDLYGSAGKETNDDDDDDNDKFNGIKTNVVDDADGDGGDVLGSYVEEFAWVQPSIDAAF